MKIVIDVPDKLFLETIKEQTPKLHEAVADGINSAFNQLSWEITKKTRDVVKAAVWKAFIEALRKALPE